MKIFSRRIHTLFYKQSVYQSYDKVYNKINFKNTQKAFQLLNNSDLIRQRNIYKMLNLLSINERIGHGLINSFMNIQPPIIYPTVKDMLFTQFCGGTTLQSLKPLVNDLKKINIDPLISYGVEYTTDSKELDKTKEEMFNIIDFISDHKCGQVIYRATSVMSHDRIKKVQAGETLSHNDTNEWALDIKRMEDICEYGVKKNVPIVFDAESSNIQTVIHNESLRMMREFNKKQAYIYSTIQFYRIDSHNQLDKLIQDTIDYQYIAGLKLVRGAYIYDEMNANRRHIIYKDKQSTDISYNEGVTKCIQNHDKIAALFASHNVESIKHVLSSLDRYKIPPYSPHTIISQIYGMRCDITYNLDNINVSQYIPYGSKEFLVPYLIRRGLENSTALGGAADELKLINQEIKLRDKIKRI